MSEKLQRGMANRKGAGEVIRHHGMMGDSSPRSVVVSSFFDKNFSGVFID